MCLKKMILEKTVYAEPTPYGKDAIVITFGDDFAKHFTLPTGESVTVFPYILAESNKPMADGTTAEYTKTKKYAAVIHKPISGDEKADYMSYLKWIGDLLDENVEINQEDLNSFSEGNNLENLVENKGVSVNLRKSYQRISGTYPLAEENVINLSYNFEAIKHGLKISLAPAVLTAAITANYINDFVPIGFFSFASYFIGLLVIGLPIGEAIEKRKERRKELPLFMQEALHNHNHNTWSSKAIAEDNIYAAWKRFPGYLGIGGLSICIEKNSPDELEDSLAAVIGAITEKEEQGRYRIHAKNHDKLRLKAPVIDAEFEDDEDLLNPLKVKTIPEHNS